MSDEPENTENHEGVLVPRDEMGRWLPGVSPNPAGRPSDHKRLRELCRKLGDKAVDGLLKEAETGETASARIAAWQAILDRGYGKPTVGSPGDEGEQYSRIEFAWSKPEGDG